MTYDCHLNVSTVNNSDSGSDKGGGAAAPKPSPGSRPAR